MKYFILVIDNYFDIFDKIHAGATFTYEFDSTDKKSTFKDASNGDLVLGYINSPEERFTYGLHIMKKINNKKCTLDKIFESSAGPKLNESPSEIQRMLKLRGNNTFIEVSEDSYNTLISSMAQKATSLMQSFVIGKAKTVNAETGYKTDFKRERIFFGAPGTGKSFKMNKDREELLKNGGEFERVTFYPDYSYANFVGTYKPTPTKDSEGKDAITYKYVPGPFMRLLVEALKNSRTDNIQPYLLLIEEINRADVASVFGDVFQLLDRNDKFISQYPIYVTEDMKKYLHDMLGDCGTYEKELVLPDNFFIWATMNSADQGVFPIDTAFKRRWNFEYIGINDPMAVNRIKDRTVVLGTGKHERTIKWNDLRVSINNQLLDWGINEDKLLGPYFINTDDYTENDIIDPDKFRDVFKNKVLMYLFEDAAKGRRKDLFKECEKRNLYSAICDEFETKGVFIFYEGITKDF